MIPINALWQKWLLNLVLTAQAIAIGCLCYQLFPIWQGAIMRYYPEIRTGSINDFAQLGTRKIFGLDEWFSKLNADELFYVCDQWGSRQNTCIFGRFKNGMPAILDQMVRDGVLTVDEYDLPDCSQGIALLPADRKKSLGIGRTTNGRSYCFTDRNGQEAKRTLKYQSSDRRDCYELWVNPETSTFVITVFYR